MCGTNKKKKKQKAKNKNNKNTNDKNEFCDMHSNDERKTTKTN